MNHDRIGAIANRLAKQKLSPWYLASLGFDPDCLVDVGVFRGTPWFYDAWPDARLKLVDPLPEVFECKARLDATRDVEAFQMAAGRRKSTLKLQVPTRGERVLGNMASFHDRSAENMEKQRLDGFEEVSVPVRRLDEISTDWGDRIGLKIDTEGSELDVLAGAKATLKRTQFVISEVSMSARFDGGYGMGDLVAAMAEHGFQVRDILTGFESRPLVADFLFVRV